jgi:tRNA(Ile)-lysidine synthase TilS/MesJ
MVEKDFDLKDIERSIIKKYRPKLWGKFCKAVVDYDLIQNGDKIAVCISGGKDSMMLAKLMQEFQRHGHLEFELEFLAMNPGFNEENLSNMEYNCKMLGIPVKIFKTQIFEVSQTLAENPCYLCARMRRGALYSEAQSLGCNKIALGHHFNDVIETTLLNVLYSGNYRTMMPKLKATNYEGMELIRPMYLIEEQHIIAWKNFTGLSYMDCGCVVTEKNLPSKRREIKELIKTMKLTFKDVDKSIFRSASNVSVEAILGWNKGGKQHSFLDEYEK